MLIIDRFEGQYAIIEINRRTFHIPKTLLPKEARPGDVIKVQITVDREATETRKRIINEQADKLFES
ncbi:Protein of unknown function [Desulfotomaculum arcticum]|uniref:DUF3006 domain-containing protein n=1 Tax=Desulfotruncus arcticus DSM 17038 TaxID=1121424 RepID=A0A1I2YYN8_9FIRM|nr:DUF3006 domain-containing protein [Desulfotruncus arcticus]SFH29821.1 Protein of unknown function [Desulfotomaculum arcticum] [Desulfotruncus arcticus DSM 17038]